MTDATARHHCRRPPPRPGQRIVSAGGPTASDEADGRSHRRTEVGIGRGEERRFAGPTIVHETAAPLSPARGLGDGDIKMIDIWGGTLSASSSPEGVIVPRTENGGRFTNDVGLTSQVGGRSIAGGRAMSVLQPASLRPALRPEVAPCTGIAVPGITGHRLTASVSPR